MDNTKTAQEVLRFIFRNRRLLDPKSPCAEEPCEQCFAPHLTKIANFIARGVPIHFVILAFPSKSPNRTKVLGPLPDHAEWASVEFLQSICEQLSYYHEPGAKVTICSDGHVFAGAVGITDDQATEYRAEMGAIVAATGAESIDFFGLSDGFKSTDFEDMRASLMRNYAEPMDVLKKRLTGEESGQALFNGIHRFLFEDGVARQPTLSRNRVREDTKRDTYTVIWSSNAWSRMVAEWFPEAVRLSIHPQPAHSAKLGFKLLKAQDTWLTPWHGVALECADGLVLVKKFQAERAQARLVWRNDRPSHYVAPHLTLKEIAR